MTIIILRSNYDHLNLLFGSIFMLLNEIKCQFVLVDVVI